MSMDFFAFLGEIPQTNSWQEGVDKLNLPMTINADLSTHTGGLDEFWWRNELAMTEIYLVPISRAGDYLLDKVVLDLKSTQNRYFVNLHWGGNWREACCAHASCAALIEVYDAAVYSAEAGGFMSMADLLTSIQEIEASCAEL